MKKLLLGLAVSFSMLVFAQYGSHNSWGNHYPDYGHYENNNFYFPEDYYYEYPNDYFADDFYNGYYNDYRRSITMVNWNSFFRKHRLTRWQIEMIMDLNNQFTSFAMWNSYYRMNPHRWYYDRFYALERILGPQIFIVYQNTYYGGYAPVVYYTNHWNNYYRPRHVVRPRYRNININIYKVNRNTYHQTTGNNYGWNQPRTNTANNGRTINTESGVRTNQYNSGNRVINDTGTQNNSGTRVQNNTPVRSVNTSAPSQHSGNSGVRNTTPRTANVRANNSAPATIRNNNSGTRNSSQRSATRAQSTPQTSQRNSSGMRSGGSGR